MGRWMDMWVGGYMKDGWMGGRMDEQVDGCLNVCRTEGGEFVILRPLTTWGSSWEPGSFP